MTVSIDDYMKDIPARGRGKHSPLRDFVGDIRKLRARGYSLQQIVDFLKKNGIDSSVPTVSSFIQRHLEPGKQKPSRLKSRTTQS